MYTGKDGNELGSGPWTLEEDDLIKHIPNHGEGKWNFLAMSSGKKSFLVQDMVIFLQEPIFYANYHNLIYLL